MLERKLGELFFRFSGVVLRDSGGGRSGGEREREGEGGLGLEGGGKVGRWGVLLWMIDYFSRHSWECWSGQLCVDRLEP